MIFSWPLDSSLVSSWPLLPTFNPIIQSSQTLSVPLKDLLLLGSQISHMLFYHPFIYLKFFSAFSEPSSGQIPEDTTRKRHSWRICSLCLKTLPHYHHCLMFMSQIECHIQCHIPSLLPRNRLGVLLYTSSVTILITLYCHCLVSCLLPYETVSFMMGKEYV